MSLFDMFQPRARLDVETICVQSVAVMCLLLDKGIITKEELDVAYARARSDIDQMLAEKRDEAMEELKKASPFIHRLATGMEEEP